MIEKWKEKLSISGRGSESFSVLFLTLGCGMKPLLYNKAQAWFLAAAEILTLPTKLSGLPRLSLSLCKELETIPIDLIFTLLKTSQLK